MKMEITGIKNIGTENNPNAVVFWEYRGGPEQGLKKPTYWFQVYCNLDDRGVHGGILPFPWQEQKVMGGHLTGAGQTSIEEVVQAAIKLLQKTEADWEWYLKQKAG
jgi:hypothetical protein